MFFVQTRVQERVQKIFDSPNSTCHDPNAIAYQYLPCKKKVKGETKEGVVVSVEAQSSVGGETFDLSAPYKKRRDLRQELADQRKWEGYAHHAGQRWQLGNLW